MTKFESGVKVVPASQEAVYEKLSDLSNLEKVNGLLDKYLGNRRGVSGRKGSKEDEPFDIDKYA